ncbi:DUF302 domain-containing protein [Candidatus Nomurabacteria bacterium]|nr:DUF302 domain-containing protein [Candidatus Nomurabacteria bacterium]
MQYGYSKQVALPFTEAVTKTKDALAVEGFGVLTEINVAATLKKKLDINFNQYVIFGACNPAFAHQALEAEPEIGLLLPCNVIVYERDGSVHVSAILPTVAMQMVKNDSLHEIATAVEAKLKTVVDAIA